MNVVGRILRNLLAAGCICMMFFHAIAYGDEILKPNYLYAVQDFDASLSLVPQTHKLGGLFGGYSNISIFPVPQNNAVGTNDIGKGITIISFPKGKIDYDRYFRNVDDIQGSGKYLPPISSDLIGFGQVRVFRLFDFKKEIYQKYRIVFPVTQYIENIAIADARQRRFIFEIESQRENQKEPSDVDYSLQLVDLSNDKLKMIKEIKINSGTAFSTSNNKVFLWEVEDKKLHVYNMDLKYNHHPLEEVVNQHKEKLDFVWISIHPNLPFAILNGGSKGSIYICWNTGTKSVPHLLLGRAHHFSFSPDGKWVVYTQDISLDEKRTYIMPVSEKYPHYLGSPILISNKSFQAGFGAWTTNPTGYAGTRQAEIYHWDLENRDFPEKGKMSFHDYIVQEDLKKLTKEKRQGLGK